MLEISFCMDIVVEDMDKLGVRLDFFNMYNWFWVYVVLIYLKVEIF